MWYNHSLSISKQDSDQNPMYEEFNELKFEDSTINLIKGHFLNNRRQRLHFHKLFHQLVILIHEFSVQGKLPISFSLCDIVGELQELHEHQLDLKGN